MRNLTAIAVLLAMAAAPAAAQQQSQSSKNEASNSAGAAINQNFESPPGDQQITTTPSAYPPGLDAGTNNCAISASAGGSVTGFGLSFGASWESEDCNERNWIALMSSRGWDDVAQAYACLHNAKMAMAFEAAGYECPERPEQELTETQVSNSSDVPGYCDDGGFASDDTIRNNCPNADALLDE